MGTMASRSDPLEQIQNTEGNPPFRVGGLVGVAARPAPAPWQEHRRTAAPTVPARVETLLPLRAGAAVQALDRCGL